jgi:hypothetical protein
MIKKKKILNKLKHLRNRIGFKNQTTVYNPLKIDKTGQEASDYIKSLIESKNPIMVGRFGSVEMNCIVDYLNSKKKYKYLKYITSSINSYSFSCNTKVETYKNAGIFPSSNEILSKFSDLMIQESSCLDVLGSWWNGESCLKRQLLNTVVVNLSDIEPYYHDDPWSSSLRGKKVLVVHPFAQSIESQYKKREMLFKNPNILPEFKLHVLKAIQTLSAEEGDSYIDWFDALERMKSNINKIDFDIAIIGCGAYGFPLAAHVKKIGKKAIHMGGATQILFGIKGSRWESIPFFQNMMNEHWVRPSTEETPSKANLVENACYW